MQTNWMRYNDLINSGNGVLWMTNVTALFAAKSLRAGKSKLLVSHTGTDSYD
jgi:hypothetical protein